jgi:hypothetical protein
MARAGRGDSRRDTARHIPVVATIADGRLEAMFITIAIGIGVSRDI